MAGIQRISVESYAHSGAKSLLLTWLRESAETAGFDGVADFCGMAWRVNRHGPSWGVFDELPILADGCGVSPVWDEVDDRWIDGAPSYDQIVQSGFRPMSIVDIAIQEKGRVVIAVEIKHKHAVTESKRAFLRRQGVEVLEVPAYWALGQVDRPSEIPGEFWLL